MHFCYKSPPWNFIYSVYYGWEKQLNSHFICAIISKGWICWPLSKPHSTATFGIVNSFTGLLSLYFSLEVTLWIYQRPKTKFKTPQNKSPTNSSVRGFQIGASGKFFHFPVQQAYQFIYLFQRLHQTTVYYLSSSSCVNWWYVYKNL